MNKCYLYYSGISALLCISALLVFSSVYKNIQGGIWAGVAALVATQCFILHCLYFSNKLQPYYSTESLKRLNVVSFVVVFLSSTFFIWYVFTLVYWKIPFSDYSRTPVFPCVFTILCGKWGLHLCKLTKEYSDYLTSNYSPITQTI